MCRQFRLRKGKFEWPVIVAVSGHGSDHVRAISAVEDLLHEHLFNSKYSLYSRSNFKLNRAAALAEWRGLCMA